MGEEDGKKLGIQFCNGHNHVHSKRYGVAMLKWYIDASRWFNVVCTPY